MEPVQSTAEVLAYKVLNRHFDKVWVDWAFEMMMAGFDTENLVILAGISPSPFYNQFEFHDLTNKVLEELQIDYSDKEQVIKNYVYYLIGKGLNGETESFLVLDILKNICYELDYAPYLYDFSALYFAKDDLKYSEVQWNWGDADRSNIDSIITEYFKEWKVNFESENNTKT
ncbi:MAG: hypothetical protein WBP45_03980 [Daejeonella sp.]